MTRRRETAGTGAYRSETWPSVDHTPESRKVTYPKRAPSNLLGNRVLPVSCPQKLWSIICQLECPIEELPLRSVVTGLGRIYGGILLKKFRKSDLYLRVGTSAFGRESNADPDIDRGR